ncbi:hypothetical protein SAMN05216276_101051 [Streptosporangium subroseum]|uniref:Uncharacterized protein n=1 Tax=Streptosporangium subroseum TaxID=106412 RepID=A0A239EST0_9ACTN|nr:hypothetical protein [Streptosporangium subroseum]SNS47736.1 hypothetical protein SAMN05216276_101051 [Streptosporangium subroseum]
MKRFIAGISTAVAVTLATAAPAQAAPAPADPVKALKSQFAAGKGMEFGDRSTVTWEGRSEPYLQRIGSFQFGKTGIVASDISSKGAMESVEPPALDPTGMSTPSRTIRIGTTSYLSGGIYGDSMPEGKTWYKAQKGMTGGISGWFGQLVNVAEPATLASLLKGAKRVGISYSGTTTFGRLAKVSPWFRATLPLRASDKTVVTFKLMVNRGGLPQRLTTSHAVTGIFDSPGWEGKTITVDTRFTSWGTKVSIKAPPASKVTTKLED